MSLASETPRSSRELALQSRLSPSLALEYGGSAERGGVRGGVRGEATSEGRRLGRSTGQGFRG